MRTPGTVQAPGDQEDLGRDHPCSLRGPDLLGNTPWALRSKGAPALPFR